MWLTAAVLSAVFAALSTILAKCGIKKTDSDVATALRTAVVLVFSWLMVFVAGSADTIAQIPPRSYIFLVLSGLTTGASWICYFKALSIGDVNKVVPIDKSSAVLSVLLAVVCFNETEHLAVKLAGTALLGAGIYMTVDRKAESGGTKSRLYIPYAAGSAVFAALTTILAKIGISGVESNVGTAIRTAVVLLMAWLIVCAKGKLPKLKAIDGREAVFIILSGIATGASWLCYYYAIQNGTVSAVICIDKMSLLITVAFSYLVFKEKPSRRAAVGLGAMTCGTLLMAVFA